MKLAAVVLVLLLPGCLCQYVDISVCLADSRVKFLDVSYSRPLGEINK